MKVSPDAPAGAAGPKKSKPDSTIRSAQRSTHRKSVWQVLSRAKSVRIKLSHRAFGWTWAALLGTHALYGLAAFGTARLYFFFADPDEAYNFGALQIPVESLRRSGWSFAAIAAAHVLVMLRIALYSVRSRELSFHPTRKGTRTPEEVLPSPPPPLSDQTCMQRLHARWRRLRRTYDTLFGKNGHFGLNGSLFEVGFEAREAIEIALQTYQALNLSRSVPRRWINSLAVVAIVTNCWTTPLAHFVLRGDANKHRRRVICLVTDMILDTGCALVIPISIALPYWYEYSYDLNAFPDAVYFDDVWFINAVAEGRFILITSLLDYFSTLVPHVSILACLLTVESLLQRASARVGPRLSLAQATPVGVSGAAPSTTAQPPAKQRRHCCKVRNVLHCGSVVWGLCVGSFHLYAQMNGWDARHGCKLHVSAWFTEDFPCSVVEVNCYRLGIRGSAEEITAALDNLDRASLRTLIITHCPALHMPREIQAFRLLGGIEVFNCSVESWDTDAAVHMAFHDRISYAIIMYSNVSAGIPAGLLHTSLPPSFKNFGMVSTNLTTLPDDIDAHWGNREWAFFGFFDCGLERVPDALANLDIFHVMLERNKLQSIPVSVVERPTLKFLSISDNPLLALPEVVRDPNDAYVLEVHARDTNISAIPAWLRASALNGDVIDTTLFNSPFCGAALVSSAGVTVEDGDDADAHASANVLAERLCGDYLTDTFGLSILLPQRQP